MWPVSLSVQLSLNQPDPAFWAWFLVSVDKGPDLEPSKAGPCGRLSLTCGPAHLPGITLLPLPCTCLGCLFSPMHLAKSGLRADALPPGSLGWVPLCPCPSQPTQPFTSSLPMFACGPRGSPLRFPVAWPVCPTSVCVTNLNHAQANSKVPICPQ